jgi:hypothetical protein
MWSIPALAKEISLQIDLAAAMIAVIALIFSIWSFRHQRSISIETIRMQRDNDVIKWTNDVIGILVSIEFLLRDWAGHLPPKEFVVQRNGYLEQLSAVIDKGRMYFPNFSHDTIGTEKPSAYRGKRQAILDRLVEFYDMIRDLDPASPAAIEAVRHDLMIKKREFVSQAQSAVDPRRRINFLEGHR